MLAVKTEFAGDKEGGEGPCHGRVGDCEAAGAGYFPASRARHRKKEKRHEPQGYPQGMRRQNTEFFFSVHPKPSDTPLFLPPHGP